MCEESLDALYFQGVWQLGMTASFGQGILKGNQYHLGLVAARRHEVTRWLIVKATAEAGIHVMQDIASGLFTRALNDIDDVFALINERLRLQRVNVNRDAPCVCIVTAGARTSCVARVWTS